MAQFVFGLLAGIIVGLVMEWVIDWSGLFPKRTTGKSTTKNSVQGKTTGNDSRLEPTSTTVTSSSNPATESNED